MSKSYTGGTNFTWPTKGDTNWDSVVDAALSVLSSQGHTGGGDGKQIATAAIEANAVTDTKVRLANNAALRARNAANSADVDVVKVDANNVVSLPTVTRHASLQSVTSAGAFTISANRVELSNAGATAATINVPTAAQAGQPVYVTNTGAGTWTVTITGRPAATDVATILQYGSMVLMPISTTTWAVVPGGGCTLA